MTKEEIAIGVMNYYEERRFLPKWEEWRTHFGEAVKEEDFVAVIERIKRTVFRRITEKTPAA